MSYDLDIRDEGGRRHIWIRGEIDEDFDASQLRGAFTSDVVLHLEDVRSISSCGIREWISFMSDLPKGIKLEFEKCSIAITRQFGMLSNFRGPGVIRSFYAPYYCDECDEETERLLVVDADFSQGGVPVAPERQCDDCDCKLEFDGVERVYFSFLREAVPVR